MREKTNQTVHTNHQQKNVPARACNHQRGEEMAE
jgi:hypothetical protein